MKVLKILIILLLGVLLTLLACNKKNGPEPEPAKYKWTILGYFNGNNSEDQTPEGHSYAIQDVQELEQIDSTEQVQVVVMLGSFKTDGNCKYYHIQRRLNEPADTINSPVLLHLGNKDMSDPNTLRDFINYGMDNYPAENTILIISDHGRGWKGLCSDTINGNGDWMSLLELSSALSGHKLFLIWFYGPLMATAEVAYQIRDRGEYMIGSQFKWYPRNYLGSTEWLKELTDNPDLDRRVFVNGIIDAIGNAVEENPKVTKAHTSLIHLHKISNVAAHVSTLSQSLIDRTLSEWDKVWDAWGEASVPSQSDSTLIDIYEFASQIQSQNSLDIMIRSNANTLKESVDSAELAYYVYPTEIPEFHGISIHLPWNQELFDSTEYVQLDFSEANWHGFLSVFIKTFSGDYAGALNVISIPPGARIFLNGVDTGYETNVVIENLLPSYYEVKFVKSGYLDEILTKNVVARDTVDVVGYLTPSP
jgi:hypothetical protein